MFCIRAREEKEEEERTGGRQGARRPAGGGGGQVPSGGFVARPLSAAPPPSGSSPTLRCCRPALPRLLCSALRCSPGKRGASRPRGRAAGGASAGARLLWGAEGPDVTSPSCRGFAGPGWAGMGRSRGEGQRRLLPRRDMPRGRMRRDEAAVPRCQNVLSLLCRINQSSVKFRDLFAVWLPCGFFQKC